ncbi:secreted protein [Candidatus Thiomargarita nelsonii]|uniref:Secreted protein n=1 Tax=Candidatus Thiomargarita nelsonii TaxID=1003181 RepID=A0A176S0E7_9GAMM|nr:secreted protein [Candidatus Thiomargarita nelsonii]
MKKHRAKGLESHGMIKLCLSLLFIFLCSCQAVKEEKPSFAPPDVDTKKAVPVDTEPVRQRDTVKPEHSSSDGVPEWMRVVERGDRAAKEKRWGKAAKFYNHACH